MGAALQMSFPLTTKNALLKEGGLVGSREGGAVVVVVGGGGGGVRGVRKFGK